MGLIGGLGVGAAVHYYQQLAKLHDQRGISMDLVMAHGEVPHIMAYLQAGDGAGLAEYLLGFFTACKRQERSLRLFRR